LRCRSFAKINLHLQVLARRPDDTQAQALLRHLEP